LRIGAAERGRGVCVVMVKSWIRAGLLAGFAAFGLLLLRGHFSESAPHLSRLAFAGGFYTLAFALRVST